MTERRALEMAGTTSPHRFLIGLAVLFCLPWSADASELRLEVSLRSRQEPGREFTHAKVITDGQLADLARSDRAVANHVQDAKRAYARKWGYDETPYGPDFWKMVRVDDWDWRVVEAGSERTLASGGKY